MKETIETRELIVLDGLDLTIRGTYHKTFDDCRRTQSKPSEQDRIGVLFLTSPSSTRAAHGDSAVYWADSFAERGYPSFRLDLPGFGDSEEATPTEEPNSIDRRRYASIASVKIRELVSRFKLAGVVIVDQCATGFPELYAAATCPECKGLVLVDPWFDPSQVIDQATERRPGDSALQGCRRLSNKICDSRNQARPFLLGTDAPEDADTPLLHRWRELASTGIPILIFKTLRRKSDLCEVDYFNYILGLAAHENQVVMKVLDGENRSFASSLGRATVRQRTEQWLNTCFPLVKHKEKFLEHRFQK